MSLVSWIGMTFAGGAGAVLRFVVAEAVFELRPGRFPIGTLAVNLSGAFVLGLLAGVALHGEALFVIGTGLIGSYTTFSTWMGESHRLAREGERSLLWLNLLGSLALGLGAAALGRAL